MKYRSMKIEDYDGVTALWTVSKGVSLRNADSKEGILNTF